MQARHGSDTGFRRRASHAGSGEKYIKFVNCCPKAACRCFRDACDAATVFVKTGLSPDSFDSFDSFFSLALDQRDISRQLYPVRHFFTSSLSLPTVHPLLNSCVLNVDAVGLTEHRFIG
jgi:hypothetical protein